MAHPFLIKDIAFQAGLSTATVDRVINNRPGVRRQTLQRVEAAIVELERQQARQEHFGKNYTIDVVMEAPDRFSEAARQAFEREAGVMAPTLFRFRFHLAELIREGDLIKTLDRIRHRGTDGLVLKAVNTEAVRRAIGRYADQAIPVITLVTDLPTSERTAYAGADNYAAGATAAYLIANSLQARPGGILLTLSSHRFEGEEARETGFRAYMARRRPDIPIVGISEGFGRDSATGALARRALAAHPELSAVYSIGGGNRAVIEAFEDSGRACDIFVAHDLDMDNRALLAAGKLTFVLHHDLRSDVRESFRVIAARHERRSGVTARLSQMDVVTPMNIPQLA
jgi:LacI family transcriptional regulator